MTRIRSLTIFVLLFALGSVPGWSAEVTVRVVDEADKAVENAIVFVPGEPRSIDPDNPPTVAIDQVDKEFVPYLTVVRPGTMITFPNSDNIRHHVYSFSEAKRFEIPLYGNTDAPGIEFDQPGVVALGCNVHDWMRAYVLVADTEARGLTNDSGELTLTLPPGEHALQAWHPDMRGESDATRQSVTVSDTPVTASISIKRKARWRAWRSSDDFEEGY